MRIISATNKELDREVEEKRFRLDLFYRINLGRIRIPPLRERREDILPLAIRFAQRAASRRGQKFNGFTTAAEGLLLDFPWPGNVRQLKNAMERLVLLGSAELADADDIAFIGNAAAIKTGTAPFPLSPKAGSASGCPATPPPVPGSNDFDLPEGRLDIEELNRRIIGRALAKHNGNRTRTAAYLGLSRRVLEGRLKKV